VTPRRRWPPSSDTARTCWSSTSRCRRVTGSPSSSELAGWPDAPRVVLLTAALDEDELIEAVRLGARGVVLKEMAPQLLLEAVRRVATGGEWLEEGLGGRAIKRLLARHLAAAAGLTVREEEIVRLAARGLRNREIGDELHISRGRSRSTSTTSSPSWAARTGWRWCCGPASAAWPRPALHCRSGPAFEEIPAVADFERYIGVRYSGRKGPQDRLRQIQVVRRRGRQAPFVQTNPDDEEGRWSRRELAEWLQERLGERATPGADDHRPRPRLLAAALLHAAATASSAGRSSSSTSRRTFPRTRGLAPRPDPRQHAGWRSRRAPPDRRLDRLAARHLQLRPPGHPGPLGLRRHSLALLPAPLRRPVLAVRRLAGRLPAARWSPRSARPACATATPSPALAPRSRTPGRSAPGSRTATATTSCAPTSSRR
jgi:hypothetical protein